MLQLWLQPFHGYDLPGPVLPLVFLCYLCRFYQFPLLTLLYFSDKDPASHRNPQPLPTLSMPGSSPNMTSSFMVPLQILFPSLGKRFPGLSVPWWSSLSFYTQLKHPLFCEKYLLLISLTLYENCTSGKYVQKSFLKVCIFESLLHLWNLKRKD